MKTLVALRPATTFELPKDMGPEGEKRLRSLHGLWGARDTSNPNNGEVAEFCALLAIIGHASEGKDLDVARIGLGNETTNAVLRDMSAGPLQFCIQKLWPDANRDEGQLRRELQYLINSGAQSLRDGDLHGLCDTLSQNLEGALE